VSDETQREIAARLVGKWEERAVYAETLLEEELEKAALNPPDRRLVQELVYGTIRWRATLDWLIDRRTSKERTKMPVRILLRLGLYQIFWLDRIPHHAAVHETVEMAKRLPGADESGVINAILRGYIRDLEATRHELEQLKATDPATGYSHPKWLVERWTHRFGAEKTRHLLEWNNKPPPMFARANFLKVDGATLTAVWKREGVQFEQQEWDWTQDEDVFRLDEFPPLAQWHSFQDGYFYLQDPSTLLSVAELDPKPGDHVLDVCAAPGGKTTLMAQRMKDRGRIFAQDLAADRLHRVKENCERLGVTCVETARVSSVPLAQLRPNFQKVLLDAPCSNSGVMRRRVDVRWRIRPDELKRLRATQRALLERAGQQVRSGGSLVYSTCSLEPEENSEVVREFLLAHPEFRLEAERELLPFRDGVDGAYVARFTRTTV